MLHRPDLRLGIDVGGTNTDAAVVDREARLVAKAKVATTPDISSGVAGAIEAVLAGLGGGAEPGGAPVSERITHVMLGTTHATNAVVTRSALRRVAVIRVGGPATHSVPPLATWPADLRTAVCAGAVIVDGGIEFDGSEIAPFDGDAVARFLEPLAGKIDAVAITSVFASVSERHETAAADIARDVVGDIPVSLSHEIGSIGLIERENATVLNAALIGLARDVADALGKALARHGLSPATYFAQNDGTLMAFEHALRYPVLTIGCGPANSMRGAAHLSGASDALVADVGGSSTEVGALVNGFPFESTEVAGIGGVRTNFRMPDLVILPLGGGTLLASEGPDVRLGPHSVGYRLTDTALVFGGSSPTLTDAAVAAGRARVGDRPPARQYRDMLAGALARSDALLAEAVDRAKVVRSEPPLIVVGGASFLVPEHLPGVSGIERPEHYEVANAIGAAIANVSGQAERIVSYKSGGRQAAIEAVGQAACAQAVRAGADPERTEVVEVEEAPLAYLTDPAVRLRVKAAGPLGFV